MTHWQLGNKEEALRCYERAAERMNKRAAPPEVAFRSRKEAAELLGVNEQK